MSFAQVQLTSNSLQRMPARRETIENKAHRVYKTILSDRERDLVVKLAIDHFVSGAPGEASAAVQARTGIRQDVVDGVLIAALLQARGDSAVWATVLRSAEQMIQERRADSREEFGEWLQRRARA